MYTFLRSKKLNQRIRIDDVNLIQIQTYKEKG